MRAFKGISNSRFIGIREALTGIKPRASLPPTQNKFLAATIQKEVTKQLQTSTQAEPQREVTGSGGKFKGISTRRYCTIREALTGKDPWAM